MNISEERARDALRMAALSAEGRDPGSLVGASAEELAAVDVEVLRSSIQRVLLASRPERGLQRLHSEGVLSVLLKEVADLVGFGEGERQHKDVWEHTKRVVAQSPPRPETRWAALLHDIGKVSTRRVESDGQVMFHGHAEVGGRMTRRIIRRFRFPRELGHRVHLLVLFHQRPSQYESSWTDSAVRRFGRETSEVLDDLLDLSRADMTTKYEGKRRRGHELIDELALRSSEIREIDARVPPLPKGLGHGIIERFGVVPGPRIGVLRDAVEAAVEAGELEPHQDPEVYLEWLASRVNEL